MAYVKDLLGENVIAWGSHFFCKMPGDGKRVSWHQDASYWPLTPSKAVTVWLAIDDADVENACMRYIPGSHVLGHLTYTLSENDEANVLNQTVAGVEKLGEPVAGGTEGRRDFDAQRSSAARVGSQPIGPPALRADAALLSGGCEGGAGVECQGRRRQRPGRGRPLGQCGASRDRIETRRCTE